MNRCIKSQSRLLVSASRLPQLSRFYATGAQVKAPPPGKESQSRRSATTTVGMARKPDPQEVTSDYIGPPDAQSNLRPYVRHYGDNETELAKKLRLRRQEVEAWNMDFWMRHNKRFYEEKEDFIRLNKEIREKEVSADRLSEFYKTFLDKNWRIHLMYNISWYLKNFDILTLAAGVKLQKLIGKIKPSKGQPPKET